MRRIIVLCFKEIALKTLRKDARIFARIFFEVRGDKERNSRISFSLLLHNTVHLRAGCPVMLVWNLNKELRNGSRGVFQECLGDRLKVSFSGVGPITIEKQTWFKRDKKGNVVGSICQFPIVRSIAVTCHKAQGLTLSAAVVHCSSEFVPGLTYIALSRVKDPKNLQVLNIHVELVNSAAANCLV